jgi:hypothetical protein
MKRLINVAALLFAAGPAAAAAPSFPPNSSQEAIAAWAKANTTLSPDTIISAGDDWSAWWSAAPTQRARD